MKPDLPNRDYIRLLIVDDSPDKRGDAISEAKDNGINNITEATSLKEAQKKIAEARDKREPFNLAVVDWSLERSGHDAGGINVTESLRKAFPAIKIIGYTSSTSSDVGAAFYNAGANAFISTGWADINGIELLSQKLRIFSDVIKKEQEKAIGTSHTPT